MAYPEHIAQRAAERQSFAAILRWHALKGTDSPEELEAAYRRDVEGQARSHRQLLRRIGRRYGGPV